MSISGRTYLYRFLDDWAPRPYIFPPHTHAAHYAMRGAGTLSCVWHGHVAGCLWRLVDRWREVVARDGAQLIDRFRRPPNDCFLHPFYRDLRSYLRRECVAVAFETRARRIRCAIFIL